MAPLEVTTNQSVNMKLSQLKNGMSYRYDDKNDYVTPILDSEFEINSSIKSTPFLESERPELIGCTALHLAQEENCFKGFKILLEHGADYTIKNKDGFTVIHQIIKGFNESDSLLRPESQFATAILSDQYNSKNLKNPCTNYGLSHFHAACLFNNAKLVQLFIENEVSVNNFVAMDSPIFPGYSPLHFAIRSYGLETIKILINSGANLNSKNAEGKTPIDMLIEQKIKILNPISEWKTWLPLDKMENVPEEYEDILHLLYEYTKNYSDCMLSFQIACVMKDSSILKSLLKEGIDINIAVAEDSPFWPGYTGLHFAALCNIENLILLLKSGADIEIKNTLEVTAFDICLKKYKVSDMHKILSSIKIWKDIVLSDQETKLLELVDAMENAEKLKLFFENSQKRISSIIPTDSPLWPGYTTIHLAVQLNSNLEIIRTCSEVGVDITARESVYNSTALHLAFRLEKQDVVKSMMNYYRQLANLRDNDNLSHLHIACASGGEEIFLMILSEILTDVNLRYKGRPIGKFLRNGFTPLHVAVVSENLKMTKILLELGADKYATDSDGLTPIHWLLAISFPHRIGKLLLTLTDVKESIVNGLSHLHVASYISDYGIKDQDVRNIDVVKKLLEIPETDVNIAVNYKEGKSPSFLKKQDGLTPLYYAVTSRNKDVASLLVKFGADILAKRSDGSTPLYDALNILDIVDDFGTFISDFMNDEESLRRVKEDIGMTKLHIACLMKDEQEIERLIRNGEDLNSQIRVDSPIWPNSTPLDILVTYGLDPTPIENLIREFKLTIDLSLENVAGNTAIQLAYNLSSKNWLNTLFRLHDFKENSVNNETRSYFHIACEMNNFYAVNEFLKSGNVDVNSSIDLFSEYSTAGGSPLHLALNGNKDIKDDGALIEVVDLLLKNGAQVNTKNSKGETPLHKAVRLPKEKFEIIKKILEAGADVHVYDIRGITAFELLLINGNFSSEELEIFIEHGCYLNAYNSIDGIGYLSQVFTKHKKGSDEKRIIFEVLQKYTHTMKVDEKGRTIIHNLVANNSTSLSHYDYAAIIGELSIMTECDVDDQDNLGRTALHIATHFKNINAINGLLLAGADINITDNNGNLACDYIVENSWDTESGAIAKYVKTLELLGLHVSPKNKTFTADVFKKLDIAEQTMKKRIQDDVERTKNIKVVPGCLSLYDFLFEINNVASYAVKGNKNEVEAFFCSILKERFIDLRYVFRLQYRKALIRPILIEQASIAFHNVSECPMEIADFIVKFLTNYELKSLIEADQS